MRGKKPLSETEVKSLRKLLEEKPLHSLLLNIGVDTMLRGSDLLNLKVSDVVTEWAKVKTEVRVKMMKTKKNTLLIPLSPNSIKVIKKHIVGRNPDDFVFRSSFTPFTKKPLSIFQYSRIVKSWMKLLGKENLSEYSTHSIRKCKPSVIYQKTQSPEICRRLLGHVNLSATQNYLGIEDSDALQVCRTINV